MLDGSKGEHPARVGGEHPYAPAQVGPLANTRLKATCTIVKVENPHPVKLEINPW